MAVVCRYVPWWLSAKEFGVRIASNHDHAAQCVCGRTIDLPRSLLFHGLQSGPCRTYIPHDIWSTFPTELQLLYRHVAEGVDDWLQPENQTSARRAMFQDQPQLRGKTLGDNSHIQVGTMSAEEWLRLHDVARL